MSIAQGQSVFHHQAFPQGDVRDPLGVWAGRLGIVGDATGGEIKATFNVPAALRSAYVHTCYAITVAQLTGTGVAASVLMRLLANWPDIDPDAGVQAFSSGSGAFMRVSSSFDTAPISQIEGFDIGALRYVLLYDPRQQGAQMDIVEVKVSSNVDTVTWSFECYGYFWDRSVLNAPGGPRHPGSA